MNPANAVDFINLEHNVHKPSEQPLVDRIAI